MSGKSQRRKQCEKVTWSEEKQVCNQNGASVRIEKHAAYGAHSARKFVIHLSVLGGCATTLQPEDSGAKQTRGFVSLLRGTVRVENPLGLETDSECVEQVSHRKRRLSTLSLWLCSSFSVVLLHVSTPESLTCGSHHSTSSSWERSQNRTTVFCLSDRA